ncbi:hypothetical protein [Scleromatobacter humisilvae]|uniref:Uncharacterized protein n=1 Tax=Scleromatobacter humisilvae TaxID=2897159 RepID=A0A9X1YES1_9BURK|nr:hypothetical protein [Scleromatobacter humisilvae]MCK9684581.1 hypothetical protein [Scleromatobacter humisilvae]
MPDDGDARLESLLEARKAALLDAVLAADGKVDRDELADCEALSKTLALIREPRRPRRMVHVLIVAAVALVLASLALIRLPSVRIGLHAKATQAAIVTSQAVTLARHFEVRWITIEGQALTQVAPDQEAPTTFAARVVRLESTGDAAGAHLEVQLPDVPAGSQVVVDASFGDGSIGLTVCGLDEPLALQATGPVRIVSNSELVLRPAQRARIVVAPVEATTGTVGKAPGSACPAERALTLRMAPVAAAIELQPNLPVTDLRLYADERMPDGTLEVQSTLLEGKLQFGLAKSPARTLQKNELLGLESASGRMRTLRVAPSAVSLDFDGKARDVQIGPSYARQSLTPRLLEWWLSQDLLLLTWSSGLAILGVLLGVWRWMDGSK